MLNGYYRTISLTLLRRILCLALPPYLILYLLFLSKSSKHYFTHAIIFIFLPMKGGLLLLLDYYYIWAMIKSIPQRSVGVQVEPTILSLRIFQCFLNTRMRLLLLFIYFIHLFIIKNMCVCLSIFFLTSPTSSYSPIKTLQWGPQSQSICLYGTTMYCMALGLG